MTDLTKILPHKPPMILLDRVIKVDLSQKLVEAEFTIDNKKMFFDKSINGVSSVCGIEFMAQTIGCYAFYANNSQTPKIGFLLGTRLYNNAIDCFQNGETYKVKAVETYCDNEIFAFNCFIYDKLGEEIASAIINVYQSNNKTELLKING